MEGELLHVRQIGIEVIEAGLNQLRIIAHLKDTRPKDLVAPNGEVYSAHIQHDLTLDLEVSLPSLVITAVRAAMDKVPRVECPGVIPDLQVLVGLRVAGGFSREVKRRLGGVLGCTHLAGLAIAMAPVVVQGASCYMREHSLNDRAKMVDEYHVNSCKVYREDGPYGQRARAAAKAARSNHTESN